MVVCTNMWVHMKDKVADKQPSIAKMLVEAIKNAWIHGISKDLLPRTYIQHASTNSSNQRKVLNNERNCMRKGYETETHLKVSIALLFSSFLAF